MFSRQLPCLILLIAVDELKCFPCIVSFIYMIYKHQFLADLFVSYYVHFVPIEENSSMFNFH